MSQDPITVTVDEAKRLTSLGNTTIFDLLKKGRLKGVKIGTRRLIYYSSIKELLGVADSAATAGQDGAA